MDPFEIPSLRDVGVPTGGTRVAGEEEIAQILRFVRWELMTTDADAAWLFYSKLFPEWQKHSLELPEGSVYLNIGLPDHLQAFGIYSMSGDLRRSAAAPHWTPLLGVGHLTKVFTRAKGLGAKAVTERFDFAGLGSMALLISPDGAPFGLWQTPLKAAVPVTEEAFEASTLRRSQAVWNELSTSLPTTASVFLTALCGWQAEEPQAHSLQYQLFAAGSTAPAAMLTLPQRFSSVPAHWLSYIRTDDPEKVAELCVALGGQLLSAPRHKDGSFEAVLRDPQGAVFGVCQLG